MQEVIDYFSTHGTEYLQLLAEHIGVSALALLVAVVIAVPVGILCSRSALAEKISIGAASVLRIIPSLAILIFLVPVLGTGVFPAVVALTVLAIPPILINTAVAFRTIPADILEAAAGMGMSTARTFFTVKAPLAFPAAFTGFRTAAIEVIASTTLAAYIGGGGLGEIIVTGMGLMRTDLLWIGGLSVAVLSIVVSQILAHVDKRVRRYECA